MPTGAPRCRLEQRRWVQGRVVIRMRPSQFAQLCSPRATDRLDDDRRDRERVPQHPALHSLCRRPRTGCFSVTIRRAARRTRRRFSGTLAGGLRDVNPRVPASREPWSPERQLPRLKPPTSCWAQGCACTKVSRLNCLAAQLQHAAFGGSCIPGMQRLQPAAL